jgi:hypothetical protein
MSKTDTNSGETGRNTGNLSRPPKATLGEDASPPVPQRHRLRLGEGDGMKNPYGNGAPSRVSSISNGKRGW